MNNLYDTFEAAQAAADALGAGHVVNFRQGGVMPYETFRLPQVGDTVSMSFNGDSYPMGEIASISRSGEKITCTNGRVFRRPRKKMVDREGREFTKLSWTNGPFSLIQGHHDERNPSF